MGNREGKKGEFFGTAAAHCGCFKGYEWGIAGRFRTWADEEREESKEPHWGAAVPRGRKGVMSNIFDMVSNIWYILSVLKYIWVGATT